MKSSVLILGCNPVSQFDRVLEEYAPQVWCMNNSPPPRVFHRWFQLHSFNHMIKAHGIGYLRHLSKCSVPLVLFPREAEHPEKMGMETRPEIIPYPVEAALELAGRPYFDTSFAWMVVMAILEGFERIIIAGVTFGKETEKLWLSRKIAASVVEAVAAKDRGWTEDLRKGPLIHSERIINNLRGELSGDESWAVPCLSYHLGIAQGRGIETIVLGEGSGLYVNKWGGGALYGMDERAGGE